MLVAEGDLPLRFIEPQQGGMFKHYSVPPGLKQHGGPFLLPTSRPSGAEAVTFS